MLMSGMPGTGIQMSGSACAAPAPSPNAAAPMAPATTAVNQSLRIFIFFVPFFARSLLGNTQMRFRNFGPAATVRGGTLD
jgi:hypothetical protein